MKARSAMLVIVLALYAAGQGIAVPAKAEGGVTVDPATRTVENEYIKISWDLEVAERVTGLYLKEYDPTYSLTASYLGEFTGQAYYVPLSGEWIGLVHLDNTDNTWDYLIGDEYVTISISSVSPGGVRVSTTYRITADSPAITASRTFGFGSTPIETSRLAPYALRAYPRSYFTTFAYPKTDGTIASTTDACEFGCPKYDWNETWMDIEAPSWDVGLGLVDLPGNPSSYAWFDRDMSSNTSYVCAAILGPTLDEDLTVSYVIYPHSGSNRRAGHEPEVCDPGNVKLSNARGLLQIKLDSHPLVRRHLVRSHNRRLQDIVLDREVYFDRAGVAADVRAEQVVAGEVSQVRPALDQPLEARHE